MIDLRNMSADALDDLSKQAAALAADLRKEQPSYALALANGVQECGYDTVRYGWVPSFSGEAEIVMDSGRRWKAIGHRPRGSADHVARNGWIEFIPCDVSVPGCEEEGMSAEAAAQFARDCQSGKYQRRLREAQSKLAEAERRLDQEMRLSETRLLELGAVYDRLRAMPT